LIKETKKHIDPISLISGKTRLTKFTGHSMRQDDYDRTIGDRNWTYTETISQSTGLDFTSKEIMITKNPESNEYYKLKRYPTATVKQEHFLGNKNMALKEYDKSRFLHILLSKSGSPRLLEDQLEILIEYMGEPVWIEYSEKSQSYSITFKYLDFINNRKAIYDRLKEDLANKAVTINNYDYFPVPLGSYFNLQGIYNPECEHRIEIQTGIQNFFFKVNSFQTRSLPYRLKDVNLSGYALSGGNTSDKSGIDYSSGINRYRYGAGERHHTQMKLAVYCVAKNKDFDEFVHLAKILNDGSSKDMMKWSDDQIRTALLSKYEYAERTFDSTYWQSDINIEGQYIPELDKELYHNKNFHWTRNSEDIDKLKYILQRIYKLNHLGLYDGIVEKDIIEGAMILYNKFKEREKWEKNTNRGYSNKEFYHLNKGSMFSKSMIDMFGKAYKLRNVRKSWELIRKSGLLTPILTEIEIDNGKKKQVTHSMFYKGMRWCKHYLSNSLDYIYSIYTKMVYISNKGKSYYNNKYINYIYNTNISLLSCIRYTDLEFSLNKGTNTENIYDLSGYSP
jgi:hypothetical protein